MKLCYLDAFSGISGDMTVGALIDAGAPAATLLPMLDTLGAGATFHYEKTRRAGIEAGKFRVEGGEQKKHRHLPQIVRMIEGSSLSDRAKRNAIAVFQRLGEAEARVHGVPMEKVHFHEVGAADSIADIAGACAALDLLGVDELYCSALNVGSGTVDTEHGRLPVPAPATAALLEGRPVYSAGPSVELTTPTGAAIATTLARRFGSLPAMNIRSSGYGAGDRDFPGQANVLRALIGESNGAAEATTVAVIEANIDDSTPEVLGYAMERLFEKGALDVTLEPVLMKKNRPGVLLRAIVRPEDREALAAVVIEETTTLGVRFYAAERRVQPRRIVEVDTPHGKVRVKVAADGSFAPEYDDCRSLALATGTPLKKILADAGRAYWTSSR
jgi:uncharacterized protein (TIGR00299 family) protein